MADCHPERVHSAKGLCRLCYDVKRKTNKRLDNPGFDLEYNRQWRKKNPNKALKHRLRHYNLSIEEYKILEEKQNYLCAICKKASATDVDHCHSTNKVRGLLCHHCNLLLGNAKDDTEILKKAIKYLDELKFR